MAYETNKVLPRLSDVRKLERTNQEIRYNKECKDLLKKTIEYYRINYPNSHMRLTWDAPKVVLGIGNGMLDEELEKLTENELSNIYDIFDYFHDERQMNLVDDHRRRNMILAKVKHIIPGGHHIAKLKGLKKKLKNTQQKIDDLEKIIEGERKIFKSRLDEKKLPNKNELVCTYPGCGRVCGNKGGLVRHINSHDKKK